MSESDVREVLAGIRRDKAAGWDGIPAALLADLRSEDWFVSFLHLLCNVCVRHGFWPEEWNRIVIAPIPKPGKPPTKPDSYRPIHLISVIAKCLAALAERHLRPRVPKSPEQLGFQTGCGTRDNAFVLRELIRKYRSSRLYVCFVDFKMAFDSVDRRLLFEKLERTPGIDQVWLRLLKAMYSGVRASVKGSDKCFDETIGVKQGDPLSPLLFLLYIQDLPEALFPDSSSPEDVKFRTELASRIIRCLLYADDLALPSRTAVGLQTLLDRLEAYCSKWRLTVNVPKTKVVVFDNRRCAPPRGSHRFTYAEQLVECVEKFKYVGLWFHESGRVRHTLADVLSASRRAMFSCIGRVTRLGPVPVSLKIALFNAYVRPVMLYCAEALPYTNTAMDELDKLQLYYVRWSLGRLSQSSSRFDTLAEVGQRPVSYDLRRARISYYLLVKSRPQQHITTAALQDAIMTKQRQESWWPRVQADMVSWGCEAWHTAVQHDLTSKQGRAGRQAMARSIRQACSSAWRQQTTGGERLPVQPVWLTPDDGAPNRLPAFAAHIDTCMLPIHLADGSGTRWYKTFFAPTCSVMAPYADVYLPARELRAFATFRLGIAHLHAHTGKWVSGSQPLPARVCEFCKHAPVDRLVVEDAYHVCVECPLYERMRMRLYTYLARGGFDVASVRSLQDMFVALLCVGAPQFVRAVGQYLVDCMAARDVYLQRHPSHWLVRAREQYIRGCVNEAPSSSCMSLAYLCSMTSHCTVANLCQPLRLQAPWLARGSESQPVDSTASVVA